MNRLPAQCECKCHDYGSDIKDCKCNCIKCKYCGKHFMISIYKYHEMICKEYYENIDLMTKNKEHQKDCGV